MRIVNCLDYANSAQPTLVLDSIKLWGPLWTATASEWTLVDPSDKSIMLHYLPEGVNDFAAKLTIDCPIDSSLLKVLSQLILYKHQVGAVRSYRNPAPPHTHTSMGGGPTVHTCRYGQIPNGYQSARASLTQMGTIDKSSSSGCQLWLNKQQRFEWVWKAYWRAYRVFWYECVCVYICGIQLPMGRIPLA